MVNKKFRGASRKRAGRNARRAPVRRGPAKYVGRKRTKAVVGKMVKIAKVEKAKVEADAKTARRGFMPNISAPDEIKTALDGLLNDNDSVSFLRKNVSKWAPDVLNMLVTPKTDEYLAEQLGMKINAVRRILNLMQGYGVTNYYVAKNTNGWLSFAWYVNAGKVNPFFDYIKGVSSRRTVVTNECNDYFMCNSCYPKDKLIFTFDAAYEAAFRCSCGQKFTRITKDAAEKLTVESQDKTQDIDTSIM